MIAVALYGRLSGVAAVTALVGTRIYPGAGPEGMTYPAILFNQVDDGSADVRSASGPAGYFRTLQQIDIYAATRSAADAIANAVRGGLDGVDAETTWGGLTIKASRFVSQIDGNFEPDPNLHRIIQQYRIVYKET